MQRARWWTESRGAVMAACVVTLAAGCTSPAPPAAGGARGAARPATSANDGLTVLEPQPRPAPPLNPSRRNIFRERERVVPPPRDPAPPAEAVDVLPAPAGPPAPLVTLLGLAENAEHGRVARTAVLSAGGGLWMVKEGETVAGRYRVTAVGVDRVDLHDVQTGAVRTLHLR